MSAIAPAIGYRVASRPTPRTTVHLTRRGRLVVFLMSLALIVGLIYAFGAAADGTSHSGASPRVQIVTVRTGDTLWGIAVKAADGGDVRAMEARIAKLNGLSDGLLPIGLRLRVPQH